MWLSLTLAPTVFQNKSPFSNQTLLNSHVGWSWSRKNYDIELHSIISFALHCTVLNCIVLSQTVSTQLHHLCISSCFICIFNVWDRWQCIPRCALHWPEWWRCTYVMDMDTRDVTKDTWHMGKRCGSEMFTCVMMMWYEARETMKAHDLMTLDTPQPTLKGWRGTQNLQTMIYLTFIHAFHYSQ